MDPPSLQENTLPNIQVLIPKSSFAGTARDTLIQQLTQAAAEAEQMPEDPRQRFYCWVQISEVEAFACGGQEPGEHLLPCVVTAHVPAGVLDGGMRRRYVQRLHAAIRAALPAQETRRLATSIFVHDVADGSWGANGALWRLPDFCAAAGYRHLAELQP